MGRGSPLGLTREERRWIQELRKPRRGCCQAWEPPLCATPRSTGCPSTLGTPPPTMSAKSSQHAGQAARGVRDQHQAEHGDSLDHPRGPLDRGALSGPQAGPVGPGDQDDRGRHRWRRDRPAMAGRPGAREQQRHRGLAGAAVHTDPPQRVRDRDRELRQPLVLRGRAAHRAAARTAPVGSGPAAARGRVTAVADPRSGDCCCRVHGFCVMAPPLAVRHRLSPTVFSRFPGVLP